MDTPIPDIRAVATPVNEASLCSWLGTAAAGDTITYFRGALSRSLCPQLAILQQEERVALAKVANRAWRLAEAGLAHLVQRRRDFEDYEYVLIARPRPRRVPSTILPLLLADAA
jgi:hypothetical protein